MIFLYFTGVVASEGMIVFAFITAFFFLFSLPFVAMYAKKDFIPINAFAELAKFIVYTKGDLYKNGIKLRLNAGGIETDQNLLNPEDIGFSNGSGYTYKPYQLERFFGQFLFRDGTFCMVSMLQISLRVRSTKRRSSGKTKTKIKHKHKFFYQLILKVKKRVIWSIQSVYVKALSCILTHQNIALTNEFSTFKGLGPDPLSENGIHHDALRSDFPRKAPVRDVQTST